MNKNIIKINDSVYIVTGKIIQFVPGPYNMSGHDAEKKLLDFAKSLYDKNDIPRHFGSKSVCQLISVKNKPGEYAFNQIHLNKLPIDIRLKIEEAFDESRNTSQTERIS